MALPQATESEWLATSPDFMKQITKPKLQSKPSAGRLLGRDASKYHMVHHLEFMESVSSRQVQGTCGVLLNLHGFPIWPKQKYIIPLSVDISTKLQYNLPIRNNDKHGYTVVPRYGNQLSKIPILQVAGSFVNYYGVGYLPQEGKET